MKALQKDCAAMMPEENQTMLVAEEFQKLSLKEPPATKNPDPKADTSKADMDAIFDVIKELRQYYSNRGIYDTGFLYYLKDKFQYVILKLEKSPHTLIDHYRADKYCQSHLYDRVNDEAGLLGPNRTIREAIQYAIQSSRQRKGDVTTAGRISYAIASNKPQTDDPNNPHWGYIPSLPPLTVPNERFGRYLDDCAHVLLASELLDGYIVSDGVY